MLSKTNHRRVQWVWGVALVALALSVRIAAWFLIPRAEFGHSGDEVSYYRCAMRLTLLGDQDLFWAPMSGWVIAAASTLLGTEKVHLLRLIWVFIDGLNVALIFGVTRRLCQLGSALPLAKGRFGLPHAAAMSYALYLPAIGYAVHLTSEALSLSFLLASLWVADWRPPFRLWRMAAAGCLAGGMVLTRPNLAPVAVMLAAVIAAMNWRARPLWQGVLLPTGLLVALAALLPAAWILRNYALTGYLFLNLSYPQGYYRAAMATYEEDLRFVKSQPSNYEAANRRAYYERHQRLNEELAKVEATSTRKACQEAIVSGLLKVRPLTPQEVFEKRTESIRRVTKDMKAASLPEQVRRGTSRLMRSLAPKTGTFDLVSRARPLLDPLKFGLFALANVQWGIALTLGLAGLLAGAGLDLQPRLLLLAVIAGGLAATPFAHGEPRYSFPVEFAFIIAATGFIWDFRRSWRALLGSRWRMAAFFTALVFLGWTWIAAARWAFAESIRGTW